MITDLKLAAQSLGRWGWGALGACVVVVALFPYLANPYIVSFALSIGMYAVLAGSWNLISGYAGYVSFGHVVYWGIGAYGAAIVMARTSLPWPVALLAGGLAAFVLAMLVARPILRLSGVYFAIATLAIAEGTRVLISVTPLAGAGSGLSLPPVLSLQGSFYLMWAVALVCVVTTYSLRFTTFGRSVIAIRENETAAQSLGIDATRRKVQVLGLSSVFAGLAGAIYVLNVAFIDPATAFDITITLTTIMVTMFGGIATVLGPVVGSLAFQIPSEMLWAQFPFVHKAALGALIVLIVLLLPKGILPALARASSWFARRRARAAEPPGQAAEEGPTAVGAPTTAGAPTADETEEER